MWTYALADAGEFCGSSSIVDTLVLLYLLPLGDSNSQVFGFSFLKYSRNWTILFLTIKSTYLDCLCLTINSILSELVMGKDARVN
jgi:hypothetical protein